MSIFFLNIKINFLCSSSRIFEKKTSIFTLKKLTEKLHENWTKRVLKIFLKLTPLFYVKKLCRNVEKYYILRRGFLKLNESFFRGRFENMIEFHPRIAELLSAGTVGAPSCSFTSCDVHKNCHSDCKRY